MDRSNPTLLLLQVLFVLAVLTGSEAIRCYTCSSDHDPRCADPIDKSLLPVDCNIDQVKRASRALGAILGQSAGLGADVFGERYAQYGGGQTSMACQKLDVLLTSQQARNQNVTVRGCALLAEDPVEHCRRVSEGMQSDAVRNQFCGSCKAEGCNAASSLQLTMAVLLPATIGVLLAGRH